MLKNVRIGRKLPLGFGVVVIAVLFVGFVGIRGFSRLTQDMDHLHDQSVPHLRTLWTLNYLRMTIRAETFGIALSQWKEEPRKELRAIADRREALWKRVDDAWKTLLAFPEGSSKERQLLSLLKMQYESWRRIHAEMDRVLAGLAASDAETQRAGGSGGSTGHCWSACCPCRTPLRRPSDSSRRTLRATWALSSWRTESAPMKPNLLCTWQ